MSTKSKLSLGLIKERLKLQAEVERLKTSNSIFADDPRVGMAAKEKQIKSIDEELARLAPKAAPEVDPIVWLGQKVEFASAIIDLFDQGKIRAKSRADALHKAGLHFVDRDGKAFKPKSLWQNYQSKQDSGKGPERAGQ